jgi:hypothetical protein
MAKLPAQNAVRCQPVLALALELAAAIAICNCNCKARTPHIIAGPPVRPLCRCEKCGVHDPTTKTTSKDLVPPQCTLLLVFCFKCLKPHIEYASAGSFRAAAGLSPRSPPGCTPELPPPDVSCVFMLVLAGPTTLLPVAVLLMCVPAIVSGVSLVSRCTRFKSVGATAHSGPRAQSL